MWIKNDAANPTHSFKDRVVAVALAKARELGFETVACASTGNLANAVAAHAAAAGLRLLRLRAGRPRGAEAARHRRLRDARWSACAATTTTSTGSAPSSAEARPWAFVNVNLRPYYAEGSKTLAFETVEQLGWSLPDRVVCPIASGSLFTKIGRGLRRVARPRPGRGRAADVQRRPGRRAAARSPTAFAEGWEVCKPQRPDTIAKSLAIGNPADGVYALELARGTGGSIDSVTDDEIRDGIRLLAETTGIFTETAGGVTDRGAGQAGRARRRSTPGERVVVYITGEGLKTLDAAREGFAMHEIEPTLEAFEAASRRPAPARHVDAQ